MVELEMWSRLDHTRLQLVLNRIVFASCARGTLWLLNLNILWRSALVVMTKSAYLRVKEEGVLTLSGLGIHCKVAEAADGGQGRLSLYG